MLARQLLYYLSTALAPFFFLSFFFFFVILGIQFRVSHLLGKVLYHLNPPPPPAHLFSFYI
jgi:hypothetical protein